MNEKAKKIAERAGVLAYSQYEKLDTLLRTLEEPNTLPEHLKIILNKIGSTPLDEKEIYDMVENKATMTDMALKLLDEKVITESLAKDVAVFVRSAIQKVKSFRDFDGKLKSTDAMKEMKLPNLLELEDIRKDIATAGSLKSEDMPKATEDIREKIKKATNLKDAVLTDWEENLLAEHIKEQLAGVSNASPVGKL